MDDWKICIIILSVEPLETRERRSNGDLQAKCFRDLIVKCPVCGQWKKRSRRDQSKLRFSMLDNRLDN